MHNKFDRGVLIMEQTLQKGKPFDQPVRNLHVDFVSVVSIARINIRQAPQVR